LKTKSIVRVLVVLFLISMPSPLLNSKPAAADAFMYFDSFDTDTTNTYNWLYVDAYSKYTYDETDKRVFIDLTDDWPRYVLTQGRIALEKNLNVRLINGRFEIKIYPTRFYPWGGKSLIKMYSSSDPGDYYYFEIGRSTNPHRSYNSYLGKKVDGSLVVDGSLKPTSSQYLYSLNEWHTLSIDFGPEEITGYLDGNVVLSVTDVDENRILVDTLYICFYQQDCYIDDISVQGTPFSADIDIDPDTLNLKSKGKWITCYIELPEGYEVSNIDVSTIRLNDIVPAESKPTEIGDHDDDGVPDLMVKFNRADVQEILEVGDEVEITVTGKLIDGLPFDGKDTIKVIDKGNR